MAYLVERLEKTLRAWEDYWFLVGVLNIALRATNKSTLCPSEDAVVNAPTFRKKLLAIRRQPIIFSDFFPPKDIGEQMGPFLARLPVCIASWCQHSRRVYHLTEEIQAILNATSLEGIIWSDISFPFLAYAVGLQRPFIDAEGDRFDFITVTNYRVQEQDGRILPGLEIRFFCQNCDQYEPLTEANRQNIRTRMRNSEWEHVIKLATRFAKRINSILGAQITFDGERLDQSVTVTAQRCYDRCDPAMQDEMDKELTITLWDSMIRIVVGMCLYLKTLPSNSPHQSEWRSSPRSRLADSKAISHEAQICTVSSCYSLTRPERIALGLEGTAQERAQYELSCHFRQGHWRRPPGLGHDPTATKTIHVRPSLVRRDRLQLDELPGGSKAVL